MSDDRSNKEADFYDEMAQADTDRVITEQLRKSGAQSLRDDRIAALHRSANSIFPQLEEIIDELKTLGRHSLDGDNALMNIREHLRQLSSR